MHQLNNVILDSPVNIDGAIEKLNLFIHSSTKSSIPQKIPYTFRYPKEDKEWDVK